MTRKRFVKRMMGLGYSRNEANDRADRARRYGVSYAARWEREKIVAAGHDIAAGLRAGISALGRSVDRFAAGLRIHHSFVDELAASGPALTQEQIDATTAKWPGGTAALVGIDLADGPDVAAQIHVAGGADNAD